MSAKDLMWEGLREFKRTCRARAEKEKEWSFPIHCLSPTLTHLLSPIHISKMFGFSNGAGQGRESKQSTGSSNSKSGDNPPPAYTEEDPTERKAKTTGTFAYYEKCVWICPHETLSFQRFQRILNLPGFRGTGMEALSAVPTPYHDAITTGSKPSQICRPHPVSSEPQCVECQAEYEYNRVHEYMKFKTHWRIDSTQYQHLFGSYKSIQYLLTPSNVWLCPHRRLGEFECCEKVVVPGGT